MKIKASDIIDAAKTHLCNIASTKFIDKTFNSYILNHLADDFAVNLSHFLKMQEKEVEKLKHDKEEAIKAWNTRQLATGSVKRKVRARLDLEKAKKLALFHYLLKKYKNEELNSNNAIECIIKALQEAGCIILEEVK